MTAPTSMQGPRPDTRPWRRAGGARHLCAAVLAVAVGGCCSRPDTPRADAQAIPPNFGLIQQWKEYDDCIEHANLTVFGILASAYGWGHREEVRGTPPANSAAPPPALPPPDR